MNTAPHTSLNAWLLIGGAFLVFLYLITPILLPFVVAMLVAYLLDPVADWLERKKLSRLQATALITIVFFLVAVLLLVTLAPLLYRQLADFLAALPGYAALLEQRYLPRLQEWLTFLGPEQMSHIGDTLSGFSTDAASLAGNVLLGVVRSGFGIFSVLSLVLLTPVVTFFLLRDWDVFIAKAKALLPPAHAETVLALLADIDRTLAGFVRGQLNVCLLLGCYYAVALSLAGLKFGAVIGLLAGLLIILPYVGAITSALLSVGLAYLQFDDINRVLVVLAIFVTGQVVEGNFITPKLVGDKVGLHPVWIIFGMLCGATLLGFVGVLIAIPVTAVVGVLARFALKRYQQSELYTS